MNNFMNAHKYNQPKTLTTELLHGKLDKLELDLYYSELNVFNV